MWKFQHYTFLSGWCLASPVLSTKATEIVGHRKQDFTLKCVIGKGTLTWDNAHFAYPTASAWCLYSNVPRELGNTHPPNLRNKGSTKFVSCSFVDNCMSKLQLNKKGVDGCQVDLCNHYCVPQLIGSWLAVVLHSALAKFFL